MGIASPAMSLDEEDLETGFRRVEEESENNKTRVKHLEIENINYKEVERLQEELAQHKNILNNIHQLLHF